VERGERADTRAGAAPARTSEVHLDAGSPFAHFRILGILGRGGMGTVYRAADLDRGGREVALKLLALRKVRDPRDEARFRREAQTAASLQHPNIGTVHEVGEHQGRLFLAMPLYDGQTLERWLDRAAELDLMPVSEIVAIAAQLAAALAAAHAAGIVHRDVKPANLILLGGRQLKLLDFGLANWEGAAPLTDLGSAVGTVVYMAPEQIRGEAGGPGADVWAFGAVVYEMLVGRPPFGRSGPQPVAWLMQAILEQEPPPLCELRPDVPPVLARIVERCLAKAPAARYANAAEILEALQTSGLLRDPTPASSPLRRLWRSAAATAAALLVLGTVFFFLHRPRPLRVAVLPPEIEGRVSAADRDRIALSLRQATLQALATVPRLRVVTADATDATIATDAADEVVTARAYCGEQLCQVVLHRSRGTDGSDLWTDTFEVPVSALGSLPDEVAPRIWKGYAHPTLR
jgi:serine/threonine protein kinase